MRRVGGYSRNTYMLNCSSPGIRDGSKYMCVRFPFFPLPVTKLIDVRGLTKQITVLVFLETINSVFAMFYSYDRLVNNFGGLPCLSVLPLA